jgi:thiosulfate dehydrogenase
MECFHKFIIVGLLLIVDMGIMPLSTRSQGFLLGVDSTTISVLTPDTTGMETAWDIPQNPLNDSIIAENNLANQIKFGFLLFTDTPRRSRFAVNKLSCNNCHLNAGQREHAMPLVGIAAAFPEYNKRAGRLISLEDRVVDCLRRSIGTAGKRVKRHETGKNSSPVPSANSDEVLALSAYIGWLSKGYAMAGNLPWRGQNSIPREEQIPIEQLDPRQGEALYLEHCANCHGEDGQGVEIGNKKAGPLWGNDSWNDGAGAARIYTLAGMFMYSMPYINPKSLTYREAQQIAAFIDSKPRPSYPYKDTDYPKSDIPADAVYYRPPLKH